MRINKFLAGRGVASRRKCDALIESGEVMVNGNVVGVGYDVRRGDVVTVSGEIIEEKVGNVYIIMNKPKGYVTTASDDRGRKTVMDLLKEDYGRIYPIGRLDFDTEGLLILTDDGDLCDRLTHPRNEVHKTYQVKTEGKMEDSMISKLIAGVEIEEGLVVKAKKIKILEQQDRATKMEMTISEGKNRQIRRMLNEVGRDVSFLKRVRIGDLRLAGLSRGQYRLLTPQEVEYLKTM